MFGYVRPLRPELKVKDFEAYQSVYCGLCHTLQKRYGLFARLTLSYDATFFALLQLSNEENCPASCRRHCVVHPFTRRRCFSGGDSLARAADISVILSYYKIRDGIRDSRFPKKLAYVLALPFYAFPHRKAAKNAPDAEAAACAYIAAQNDAEQKRTASVDEAAHPTARMLEQLLSGGAQTQTQARILSRLGYFLGRWVYMMDAADDFDDDRRTGSYNPFAAQGEKRPTELIERLLNSCLYEIAAAASLQPEGRFDAILKNIFFLGLPGTQKAVLSGQFNRRRSRPGREITEESRFPNV